jgi:hypothetical protein
LGILIKAKFNFLTTKNSLLFDYNPYLAKKKKKKKKKEEVTIDTHQSTCFSYNLIAWNMSWRCNAIKKTKPNL